MKSKIPCLPGFLPVMKDVQAGAVKGWMVERSLPEAPVAMISAKCGSLPSLAQGLMRSKVAPSKPMTNTLPAIGLAKHPRKPTRWQTSYPMG